MSAFEHELDKFVATLADCQERVYAKRKCTKATIHGHEIYVTCTGIGTTHAASTTTALCETMRPDCIIMCGSAGGLPGTKLYDLVVSNNIVDIDLYNLRVILTGTPYEPCLTDPHTRKPIEREYSPHPTFLEICAASSLPDISKGVIGVSNTFPTPKHFFAHITEARCAAIEMESSGVFNAANFYDVPVVTVRAVSNLLDAEGNDLGTATDALTKCSDRLTRYLTDLMPRLHDFEPVIAAKKKAEIEAIAAKYSLARHPEGGWYRQTHRSSASVVVQGAAADRYVATAEGGKSRSAGTSIVFMLEKGDFSAWHSVESDETWYFHEGEPLSLRVINPSTKEMKEIVLTPDAGIVQYTVPAGHAFSALSLGDYSVVGCAVSPGFDFAGFKLISKAAFTRDYPMHTGLVELARDVPVASAAATAEGFSEAAYALAVANNGSTVANTALPPPASAAATV